MLDDESDLVRVIHRSFEIFQKKDRTELKEAIARAAYWYSAAHRDPVVVMKLIKYWSCVEAFFSFGKDEPITPLYLLGSQAFWCSAGFDLCHYPTLLNSSRKLRIFTTSGHEPYMEAFTITPQSVTLLGLVNEYPSFSFLESNESPTDFIVSDQITLIGNNKVCRKTAT